MVGIKRRVTEGVGFPSENHKGLVPAELGEK